MHYLKHLRQWLTVSLAVAIAGFYSPPTERDDSFQQLEPLVKQILHWFPAETESVVYLSNNFPKEYDTNEIPIELANVLHQFAKGKFLEPIKSLNVKFEIIGSCRFRPPIGLGGFFYDGCHAIGFENVLDKETIDKLLQGFAADASIVETIKGHRVFIFEERDRLDAYSYFVCLPQPDVLLVATDKEFLAGMLDRINEPPKSLSIVVKDELWGQLDVRGGFWAFRTPVAVGTETEWNNDDGFVAFFDVNKSSLVVRNLLIRKNFTSDIVRRWELLPPNTDSPTPKLISPLVVEFEIPFTDERVHALFILVIWRSGYQANI